MRLLLVSNLVQTEFAILRSSILLGRLHHLDREREAEQPSQHDLPPDLAHVCLDLLPGHPLDYGLVPLLL